MKPLRTRSRGAAGSQYAIILGLIVVVAMLAIPVMGSNMGQLLTRVSNALGNSGVSGGGSGSGGGGGGGGPPPATGDALSWGNNTNNRLGDGTTTNRTSPVQILGAGGVGFLQNVTQIKGGEVHGCALATAGTVWCWGYNGNGPLGNGTFTQSAVPVPVTGLTGVVDLGVGGTHTCALTGSTVKCWGYNAGGSVGDGTTTDRSTPQTVISLGAASAVEAGGYHSCALVSGGVWCWGYNIFGALGINSSDSNPHSSPVQTRGVGGSGFLSGISALSMQLYGSCALSSGGQVYCWGWNPYGQIGHGNTGTDRHSPALVLGVGGSGTLSGIAEIAGATHHACARSGGGNVWCWGLNDAGALGDGTATSSNTPVQVRGPGNVGMLGGIAQISAGGSTSCARNAAGSVWCWGENNAGQLGIGSTTDANLPTPVLGVGGSGTLTGVTYIGVGYTHSHAIR